MKRKLHRAMLALSTTAAVFTLLLLAGSPVSPAPQPSVQPPLAIVAAPLVGAAASVSDVLVTRSQLRHSRALLALPYFSFAQGLRRTGS